MDLGVADLRVGVFGVSALVEAAADLEVAAGGPGGAGEGVGGAEAAVDVQVECVGRAVVDADEVGPDAGLRRGAVGGGEVVAGAVVVVAVEGPGVEGGGVVELEGVGVAGGVGLRDEGGVGALSC